MMLYGKFQTELTNILISSNLKTHYILIYNLIKSHNEKFIKINTFINKLKFDITEKY